MKTSSTYQFNAEKKVSLLLFKIWNTHLSIRVYVGDLDIYLHRLIVFLKYVGHPWTCFFSSQSPVSYFEDWKMVTTIEILACQSTRSPNTP
jgi:hypothetical protein